MLYEKINEELKQAMRNQDTNTKNYIRSIKSKITEYQVLNNMNRTKPPEDNDVIYVISAHKKSLEKAIKMLEKDKRSVSLVEEYSNEIDYCNRFIPYDTNDIEKLVEEAIKEVGNNFGKIMGYILKNNKGLDGLKVKIIVLQKIQ